MIKHLRQHSKIVLAIVCVVLMLAWLVLPSIEQAFQARGGAQADPVKVTWKGGRLKASELQHMRIVHKATVDFVTLVIQEAIQQKGNPHGAGVNLDLGLIGISRWQNNIDQENGTLVETLILAQHARELGVTVNDQTVKEFLRKLGDYALDEADLAELLDRATPDSSISVTPGMIFEHLKTEILAQQAKLLMLQAGIDHIAPGVIRPLEYRPIFFGANGALPPGEMWQAYERLHRRVEIAAFPLHVKDFVGKVTKEPSEAELKKLFEEGRTRLPNPAFPQPGFMQPHKVAFQYIKADLEPFLEAAKLEITEEQIAKAYEEGKARGEFKVEEPPPPQPGDKPAETPADPNAPQDPAAPADKPATDKPATDKPTTDKPDDKPADQPEPKEDDTKKDDAKKDDAKKDDATKDDATSEPKKNEPKKNEGSAISRDVHLVKFQEEDKQPAGDAKKPAEEKPADKKPAEKEESSDKPAEAKPADPKSADSKPADEKPADEKPANTKPADPAATPAEKPEEKEVKFKPLEEVKDEIRTNLARPIASDRRQALIDKVITAVNTYSRQYNRWKAYADREKEIKEEGGKPPKTKIEKPAPLDLSKIIGDSALKVEAIPLVDQFEVQEMVDQPQADGTTKKVPKYEIGVQGMRIFDQGGSASFAQFAFDEGGSLYQPETLPFPWEQKQFMGGIGGTIWIFWRTDEQKAKELDFAAVRDQVLAHWKEQEALKLAEEEARKLAAQAGEGKELKSLVAKPEQIITPPAFSWLSTGLSQFGLPSPSEIAGIEYAGNDFRRAVFDLEVGEAGVAMDQPHKTVYVVKVLGEEGISDADRQRFLEQGVDRELLDAAWQSQVPLQADLYSELFKQYDVSWAPSTDEENS